MFYEQRNLYLTGAVLFLSLLLNRFFALIADLMSNETRSEALKKQAAKQSTDYLVGCACGVSISLALGLTQSFNSLKKPAPA